MNLQAIKLPKNAVSLVIYSNEITGESVIAYEVFSKKLFKPLITKKGDECRIVGIVENEKIKFYVGGKTTLDFINECKKMDVKSPVLAIIEVK